MALTRARSAGVAQRLKAPCSHNPWYRKKAEADPDFRDSLAGSCFNLV